MIEGQPPGDVRRGAALGTVPVAASVVAAGSVMGSQEEALAC